MKSKYRSSILIPLSIFLFLNACEIIHPKKFNLPPWEPEILGPLVNTSPGINQIIQFKNTAVSYSVFISDAGIPSGTASIPSKSNLTLPIHTFPLSTSFKSITLDSGTMNFSLQNGFPIDIKAGTVVTLVNATSQTVILSNTLPSDIPALGNYTMIPPADLSGKTIEDSVQLVITNFGTDGSVNPITVNNTDHFTLTISLQNPSINKCTIAGNDTITIKDTSAFSIQGYKITTEVVGGTLTVFSTNRLPITSDLQIYFLDTAYVIRDSLFKQYFIVNAAPTDGSGNVTGTTQDSVSVALTDTAKLSNIRNARHIISYLHLKSVPNNSGVTITKDEAMNLILVGDLFVKLNQ